MALWPVQPGLLPAQQGGRGREGGRGRGGEGEREQETESEHQAKTEAELAECGMVGRGSECDENHTALKE